ncbi:hypothetical protein [Brevundimonas sp.]|uniref:hypothetical protein n=1 Tax=Brevundimonas sp. TaxID=1871086 RepID=UPI002D57C4E5|nr:hypothetical protein [Brevundimonas sp.]HYC74507.1 hypothetical protein [Brevundimonas sp.]
MNKIIPTAAALALALSLPLAAEAQNNGKGNGNGRDSAQDRGGGHGADHRQDRGDRRRGGDEGPGRGQERADRDRPDRSDVREMARVRDSRGQGRGEGQGRGRGSDDDRDDRRVERAPRVLDLDDRTVVVFRAEPDRGLIAGCPPGLAKRNNGCLPPGQERKIARARYDWLWDRDPDFDWRYDDGYLYRLDRSGSVTGWLPALGGALVPGAVWPQQYAYQPVAPYYTDYFRLNDPYDYRYANGALYGVDPRTQAITQVVALLTGQPITVGQPMPAGYDVYNVPYAYRDRYMDTADSWYRYNDGYVYRVDPTTQLVQAAIQLLT